MTTTRVGVSYPRTVGVWWSGGHEVEDARFGDEKNSAEDSSKTDIWEDEICLGLLKEGVIPDIVDLQASKRARKRATDYC